VLDLVREEHEHVQRGRRFPRESRPLDIYSRTVNAHRPVSEALAEFLPWCEEQQDDIAALLRERLFSPDLSGAHVHAPWEET
jgi:hypothetical protein